MTASLDPMALLPVGTILAYAGVLPEDSLPEGWLLCDGLPMLEADAPELFAAIGCNFGKPGDKGFNLPNLAGQFLRGTSGESGNDPDVKLRTALMAGGATAAGLGSYQKYGTHPATKPFKSASVDHLNISSGRDQDGCNSRPASYNDSSVTVGASGGGDKESRPVNKYVYFIIKSKKVTSTKTYVVPPIGTIIPFAAGITNAGELQQNWLLCNGMLLDNKGVYEGLFDAIGFAHGQASSSIFVLPDYQGYFLRGVDNGAAIDPDSNSRTAPYPQGTGAGQGTGNAKDMVGSVQTGATGLPTKANLDTTFSHLPTGEAGKRQPFYSTNYSVVNTGTTSVNLSASGGDNETRPINYYVDWYIRFA